MTAEQKAKAYDEAIERAKKWYNAPNIDKMPTYGNRVIEEIFPELKESEDEKIRKELIKFVKVNIPNEERYIAWLEKQSEQKPTLPKWKYKKDNTPLLRDSIILNKYGCVAKSPSGAIVSDVWVINYDELAKLPKEEIEKQGEQKPIIDGILTATNYDKMFQNCNVHKFNVGDWIVFNGLTLLVNEVVQGYYRTISIGGISNSYDWDIDNVARLWTIQDAKPGDVVSDGTTVFIFKDLLSDGSVMSYCDYDTDSGESDAFCPLSMNLMCSKITPATNEQRDLLFQKMKEAGYMWDFEKKKLKKIENAFNEAY